MKLFRIDSFRKAVNKMDYLENVVGIGYLASKFYLIRDELTQTDYEYIISKYPQMLDYNNYGDFSIRHYINEKAVEWFSEEFILEHSEWFSDVIFRERQYSLQFIKEFIKAKKGFGNNGYIFRQQSLTQEFFEENYKSIKWLEVLQYRKFNLKFIARVYLMYFNGHGNFWATVANTQDLTEKDIEKYMSRFNECMDDILVNQPVSEEFILKHKLIEEYTEIICEYQQLSEDFMEKYVDFESEDIMFLISANQQLSEAFIERHTDKVYWYYIFLAQDISEEFFKEHFQYLTAANCYNAFAFCQAYYEEYDDNGVYSVGEYVEALKRRFPNCKAEIDSQCVAWRMMKGNQRATR